MNRRVLLTLVAIIVCLACVIGGTVAWLGDITSVTNTFIAGDISMTLTETTGTDYKLIPGAEIAKNPTIVVETGSEASWLFVKITKGNNLDEYIRYTIADEWTELSEGVYYLECPATLYDTPYRILKGDSITVIDTLTEERLAELSASGAFPTLSFTAYAVQKSGISSVDEAWEIAKNL